MSIGFTIRPREGIALPRDQEDEKMPTVKSAKRITTAREPPPADLAELSTVELGKRHLNGTGVAAMRAKAAKKETNGKIRTWPSGLDSWGSPTWCCPECEHVHRQSVCPAACRKCGTAGDPSQNFKGKLPAAAFDRGPIPPVHPASTSTTTPAVIAAHDPLALPGVCLIRLDQIHPSPENPRKTFPPAELEELARSIEFKGLQQPLEVLPADAQGSHELLDGERRFRALLLLRQEDEDKWRSAPALIKPLSPLEARDYRLTTFVRAGLNAIDQARAFRARLDAGGITQAQLGALVGLTQGAIANKLRLLDAPEALQAKVISGEISERILRDVLAYGKLPGVLEAWAKSLKKGDLEGQTFEYDIDCDLNSIARDRSRPMSQDKWRSDSRLFKTTTEIEKQLDVRTVGREERAFNTKLWDQLQKQASDKKSARADAAEAKGEALTPAEKKARAQKQAEIFEKRLYRYKLAWLQKALAQRLVADSLPPEAIVLRLLLHFTVATQQRMSRDEELIDAAVAHGGLKTSRRFEAISFEELRAVDPAKLWNVARAALAAWVQHEPEGWHVAFGPDQIEALASELGIDLKKEWRVDQQFLELHTRDQLGKLAGEWKVIAIGEKRSEAIKSLLAQNANTRLPCPKELLDVKAVRL